MAKRQKPKAAGGKSRGTSRGGSSGPRPQIESSRNDEYPLPDDLAKLFDDLLSRSFQAAQAEQEFRSTMAQAAEEFGREQARVMNALTQQMGLSAALQELESLRDRQNR